MADATGQFNQNQPMPQPEFSAVNLNQDLQRRRELNRAQRSQRQMLESEKAEQFKQGPIPQGLSTSAGMGTGQAWPAQEQALSPNQTPKNTAASAGQAAGTAMKAGGKGIELGGKAAKFGGEMAGKGVGGAIGGAAGAVGGVLGGPEGMLAGARAGAKAGATVGGKVGKLPGQAVEKGGQAVEKAGDKTKSFSRNLKDKIKKSRDDKNKKSAIQEKISETVGTEAASALLLRTAWFSQLSIAGFVTAFWGALWYIYMLIHFIGAYLTPFSNYFCKFGHEWTKATGIPTVLKQKKEKTDKKLELVEISLFALLGIFYLAIILTLMVTIAIIIYAWTHPVELVKQLGLTALKYAWGKVIGVIGL